MESALLKPEILDFRPVTLGNKRQFFKGFFGVFEILEHPFPPEHFQKICNGGFSPVIKCRLQLCNSIKWELQMFSWMFFKVFGAVISKYHHETISDGV